MMPFFRPKKKKPADQNKAGNFKSILFFQFVKASVHRIQIQTLILGFHFLNVFWKISATF